MHNILTLFIKYIETLEFLSGVFISNDFQYKNKKNLIVNILYNLSDTNSFGEDSKEQYIIQMDILAKYKKDALNICDDILNHFSTHRIINIKENNELEINDNAFFYNEIITDEDNDDFTRITIKYLSCIK